MKDANAQTLLFYRCWRRRLMKIMVVHKQLKVQRKEIFFLTHLVHPLMSILKEKINSVHDCASMTLCAM
jgi:hypothetical protein